MQCPVYITDHRTNPFEFRYLDTFCSTSGDNGFVVKTCFVKVIKAIKVIGDNIITCTEMLGGPSLDDFFGKSGNLAKAHFNRMARIIGE